MEQFALYPEKERREIFGLTAAKLGIKETSIEKDFWVCLILKAIFESATLGNQLLFKGGTSLSKVYNLIERFSEDIDLVLDWRVLGFNDDEAWATRSKTQQDKYNERIDTKGVAYIAKFIVPELKQLLSKLVGGQLNITIDEKDGHNVFIAYPSLFPSTYLFPIVKLEIGPRASRDPYTTAVISSYVGQEYPTLFKQPDFSVKTIVSERTFWEKVMILHEWVFRAESKRPQIRYSRHYYDLYKMIGTPTMTKALNNIELLKDVVAFRRRFYPTSAVNYDLAVPGTIKLLPSNNKLMVLKDDYGKMQEMFFGEAPSFDEIINKLQELETQING